MTLAGLRILRMKGCGGARVVMTSMVCLFTPTLVKNSTALKLALLEVIHQPMHMHGPVQWLQCHKRVHDAHDLYHDVLLDQQ